MDIKLIHGDCYKELKKLPDNSIDLIYIDIPYEQETNCGKSHAVGKKNIGADIKKYNRQLSNVMNGIDYSILDELSRLQKYTYIYIWCNKEQIYPLMKYYTEKGIKSNILVWCKTNPIPATNGVWLPDIEYCLVFKEKGSPRYNDGFELKSKWYISSQNAIERNTWHHPTIKPLELVERHIKHSTEEGDTVLDCFMGSGTTGVACRNLNRKFIGIEIDDEYFKIAERRIKIEPQQFSLFD